MIHTLADCIDARIVSLHCVVDHNAAIAIQPGRFRQCGIGANADCHHDELSRHFEAVSKADRLYLTTLIAEDFFRILFEQECKAAIFKRFLQQFAGNRIKLALHQPVRQMHDRHIHPAQLQSVCRFKPEQTAADDDRMPVMLRRFDHRVGVLDIAIGNDTLQILAGHWQHERRRTGCQQQAVIFAGGAVFSNDNALAAIDFFDLLAKMQRNVIVSIPIFIIQHDVFDRLLTCQHRRQQDAIVVCVRFGAEHRDVIYIWCNLQQLLQRTYSRHTISNHDQLQLLH